MRYHVLMRLSQCFFAGIPTETDWSQSYAHQTDDSLFGLIVHVGNIAGDPSAKGKEILAGAMELAATVTRENFLSFFKKWEEEGVDIAGIYVVDGKALLFARGETVVMLTRGGNSQTILKGSQPGQYVEGECHPSDYFTLATTGFVTAYPDVGSAKDPQEACDLAVGKLHTLPDSSKVTALFVMAAGEQEKSQMPVVTVSEPKPVRQSKPRAPMSERSKKIMRLAVLAIIGVIIILAISSLLTSRKASDIAKTLAPYDTRYEQLLALGPDKQLDKLRGLRELSRDLSDRVQQTKETSLKRAYEQLLSRVNETFANASGEKHMDKLPVYYDFRLIAPDFVANAVGFDTPGKLAVFLDGSHSRLLSLSLETKEALTLSVDEQLAKPFALAVENRKAYVLGDSGVMALSLPLDKLGSIVILRDSTWNSPKLVDVFGTNAYIFDSGVRNILKYDLTNTGASPSGWMRNKEGVDFDLVTSIKVDGGVWVGESNGKLFRFMQGAPSAFSYTGVLDQPTSTIYVYTTQESGNLYVLEPHAKRLLILNKNGEYQKSITSDDLATTTGLIVDETVNKAYILSGSLVYEVGL